jgi:enamine deaminase RidA (YjgF/YER057c/UK114 family)
MRERQRVSSGGRWEPLVGYSRAVRVGQMAWVSGCTAAGPDGAVVGQGDAYAQTVQAIRTMGEALGRVGLTLGHVVKTGVYLADMSQWEGVARAHREAFGEVRPACTWVECGTMIHPDMLVEIDAVAVE